MELSRWLSCLQAGNTPHGVCLTGPEGTGKKEYARQAAALYLLGRADASALAECPYYQELPNYQIKTLRECCAQLNGQVYGPGRRCLLIPDAHRLAVQAQNALLKTLEEPPAEALVLLTGNEQSLLPTVRSRCMLVRVAPMEAAALAQLLEQGGVSPERARLAAALSGGVPALARRFAEEEYVALRAGCLELIEEALFSVTPFARATALLETKPEKTADEEENEAAEEGSERKKRVTRESLADFMDVLLGVLRDGLLERLGGGPYANLDIGRLRKRIADHFTIGEIQCMIAETLNKRRALMSTVEEGKAAGSLLDALLIGLGQREYIQ